MSFQGAGAEAQVVRAIVGYRDGVDLPVLGVERGLAPHQLRIPQTRWQDVLIDATGLAVGLHLQPRRAPGGADLVAHAIVVRGRIERHQLTVHPDRKSTRLNSSHQIISYAVFCLKKKKITKNSSKQLQLLNILSLHIT